MDSGSDTPEGFLHETKFVVLSYLGLVPPDFDPGFSEFDNRSSGSSHPQTPFSFPGSEEGSNCASPRFLSAKSRFGHFSPSSAKSKSPALSPRGSQRKHQEKVRVEHDEVRTTVDTVTRSGATGHIEIDRVEESVKVSKVPSDGRVFKDNPSLEAEMVKVGHSEIRTSVHVVASSGVARHVDVDMIEESIEVCELPQCESSPGYGVSAVEDDLEIDAGETEERCEREDKDAEVAGPDAIGTMTTVETTDTLKVLLPLETGAAPEINIVSPGSSPSVFKPPAGSGDSPKLIIPSHGGSSGPSSGSSSSEMGKVSSDSDSVFLGVDESWSARKRKSIEELTEPLREELQEAFNHLGLEKEYYDVMCPKEASQCNDSPTEIPSICPISREAIVAERIAQIGDMIMESHREELEAAMAQVFGENGKGGNMNYVVFRSMVQHMVRSAVPEWYHLALMLNFTRRMAFGFLRRGNHSMGYLSDYAVRYIEENLAETIIENGGWDAMININPEDISEELSSRSGENSSRGVSPLPPDHLSHSSSPMPSSPIIIKESPVDPPIWKHTTTTHVHVTTVSQSDIGVDGTQTSGSQSDVIKPNKSNICNSVPSTLSDNTDQPDGHASIHPSNVIPSTDTDGTVQTTSDQLGDALTAEDHTQVDSTVVDGDDSKTISHYLIATATCAAAAAGAVYALMKK